MTGREAILGELRFRIRDVREGPDELLYVVTLEDAGEILRLEPDNDRHEEDTELLARVPSLDQRAFSV